MRAVVFDGAVNLRDVTEPVPAEDEAVIAVRRVGVCNTDLEIIRGYMGYRGVMGHEMVGEVTHSPVPALVGSRVAAEINVPCGRCPTCLRGLGRHCETRQVMGIVGRSGCFAERVALPVKNLHEVPHHVTDDQAVFVEPLAAAFEILEQVHVIPGQRVAVIGDGKLGLLIAMVMLHHGCSLTAVGKHDRKLAIVSALGARTARPDEVDGETFDLVVEATGSPTGLQYAIERVRPRGTLVLKSTFHGQPQIDASRLVVNEIRLVGSRCGPYAPAISALARGSIDPTPLIDARFDLSDAPQAIAKAQKPGTLKVLINIPPRQRAEAPRP